MSTTIVSAQQLAPQIFEMVLHAPDVARKAKAGQFCIVMARPNSERIPLTLADWDETAGTVTLVIMALGTSTRKLCELKTGDSLFAFAAPLGQASEIHATGRVILAAGGVGAAPVHPIAKAFKRAGHQVTLLHAARTADLLFWQKKLAAVSDEYIITTDDGSTGTKALITEPLRQILSNAPEKSVSTVYAIGPVPMMRACSETTRPFGVHTVVSLNTIMIDGTGMCGGCRVLVGGKAKFTCVDGPEFDGHLVDWESMQLRQKSYHKEEECSLNRYVSEEKRG
jgi:ferredoxin--NADP+ reductase